MINCNAVDNNKKLKQQQKQDSLSMTGQWPHKEFLQNEMKWQYAKLIQNYY